jgi:hypothetical protein
MNRGNPSGLDVSIERSRAPQKLGRDVSTSSSAPWVPRISHEILRDLGMSDDAIAQYFSRFRLRPIGTVHPNGSAQTSLDVS